jgi:hypothetical protein
MAFDLSQYQPVEERLREFWNRYPSGRITTTLIHHEEGDYIVQAHIYRGDELRDTPPVSTGLAHDSFDQLPPNMRQSALEVCETSAIGRALANMGFAPKGARPSREEMHKASAASTWSGAAEPSGPPAASSLRTAEQGTTAHSVPEGNPSDDGAPQRQDGEAGAAARGGSPSSDPLADLLEAVGGSEVKAVNAINKAVGGAYRKSDLESLTPDEYAAGLAAVVMA